MEIKKEAMTSQKNIVRDVFLVLLCATVIGVAVSAIVHKAAITFNPFLTSSVSQTVNIFVSSQNVVAHNSSSSAEGHNSSSYSSSSLGIGEKVELNVEEPVAAPDPAPPAPPLAPPLDELDIALAKTADANKTVIITALNQAWAEPNSMIDLFLESFRIGEGTQQLLDNLLIVALDAKAYNRCIEIHPHCYTLKTRGVDFSAEKQFMSDDYLKMMWTRLGFLANILKRGYSFAFSDCDIMWLRNPFTIFSLDADIQIASDRFNGRALDLNNFPNGGYKYVRSNERTVGFYKFWYMSRRLFPGVNEQDVLNILKFRRGFGRFQMKFMFLNTKYFGGFCERSQSLDDVYTMHANCCKGLKAKLIDLRQALDDWLAYSNPDTSAIDTSDIALNSTSPPARNVSEWRPPYACLRSWDP
uniref:TSA: Wollemia nobilis Ref_Wollemi_Transcript_22827_1831 transcribed RNA sequence n=1 Tax=Wollemia nobilis TaxID=56998 RepID=A0A0C9S1S0_9CONI